MPPIINKSVQGIGFGFLHDDEIKKLSVKQLTNSQSFDSLRQPVIGGLYDRAYGPTDPFDTCDTCDLSERDCPGHPGHLQLAVPLYDIFLLELLIKLLNAKCWNCHHLRLSTLKKKFVYCQLLYLNAGQILLAREVSELMNPTIFRKYDETAQSIEQRLEDHILRAQELLASATPTQSRLTFHVSRTRNELIRSFMSSAKTANGKCQNCGACSPSIRRDGFAKIFLQSLNSRQKQTNDKLGIRIHSIMSKSQYETDVYTVTEPAIDSESKKKFKKEQKRLAKLAAKKKKRSKKSSENGEDESDDSDSDFDDLEDELIKSSTIDQSEEVFGEAEYQLAAKVKKEQQQSQQKDEIFAKINAQTDVEETTSRLILPNEVERHMALLWGSNDNELLSMLFCPGTRQMIASNPYNGNDYRAFFHRVLLVPPARFRPPRYVDGLFMESAPNVAYRKIFDANEEIVRTVFSANSGPNSTGAVLLGEEAENEKKLLQAVVNSGDAESKFEKLSAPARKRVVDAWISMQQELNIYYDSDKTGNHLVKAAGSTGIKQILEKKQGLFRKNMMGKRVNFAARSVISPDPYLHAREIGVPEIFAKTLTFPEPVAAFNYQELRQAVINGPFVHPGANAVITSKGRQIQLSTQTLDQRTALANQLLGTEGETGQANRRSRDVSNVEKNLSSGLVGDTGPMVVLRHLRSGDVLLVNRQPTLHKPSMMAHIARVLFGEQVLRMHYSNCNAYNADYDGDEMNLHFPQNQLARIEAYDIANTDNQYIVPTSGNPLRGLIQDHVVCGVRLTSRGSFLNREYFQQFLFLAIADKDVQNGSQISTPEPTILKPRVLWTGKQIINTILDFVAENRPPLNLAPTKAKVPGSAWGKQGEEDGLVAVRENKLVHGVLDKAMFGASKYGLVHAVYELYGAKAAGNILTIFSRLFTRVLQYDAFTCGIEDFLLTTDVDTKRRLAIEQSTWDGVQATATCAGLEGEVKEFGPGKINEAVQRMYSQFKNAGEMLDNAVKAALSQNTSNIIKLCIPNGQRIPFPRNNMAMMTLSGAKGSAVNHSQIACLLGQQELEGRRVPVTMAGKTLPSFPRYDPQPRAGGYITQRFFTGIRPQEYYYHCMSGREGLVDTAVKTARSGYLQRCLIKLLEGLNIKYDNTVRDVDNSIVQFQYGDDGIDPVKAGYLGSLPFLATNFSTLMAKLRPYDSLELLDDTSVDDHRDQLSAQQGALEQMKKDHAKLIKKEDGKIAELAGSKKEKEILKIAAKRTERSIAIKTAIESFNLINSNANDPISSKFPIGKTLGAVSEKFRDAYLDYISKDPDGIFANSTMMQTRWTGRLEDKTHELEKKTAQLKNMNLSASSSSTKSIIIKSQIENLQEQIKEIQIRLDNIITPEKFIVLMNLYYMHNLAHAGENVGVLAGQSVGEPSTQMTLNTFHLAGHGGANVTLGIPRLREIVMTASDHISTPIMKLPLINPTLEAATKLAAKLNKVKLSECLQSIGVTQTMRDSGSRQYKIRLTLKDLESEWAINNLVTPYNIAKCVAIEFSRKLQASVQTKLRTATSGVFASRIHRSHAEVMTSAEEDPSLDDFDNDDLAGEMDASERRKMRDLEEGMTESQINSKKVHNSYDDDESDQDESDDDGSDDETDETKKKKAKKAAKKAKQASNMDDVDADTDSDDDDEDESSDNDDSDSDDETTMGDKRSVKRSTDDKSSKTKSKSSKTKSTTAAQRLTSDGELSAMESSSADFNAFCKKLVPYWGRHHYISTVDFDKDSQFIDIVIITPQGASKLLMLSTIESLCDVCRVRYTEGINKAIVVDHKLGDGRKVKLVQTDGVNLNAIARIEEIDHNNIQTNDIHRILKTYGVEAASASIRGEIAGVFAVYGIVVDPRHLSLISDFMTFQGGYHAMNRNAMGSRPSVLQKATFETSLRFILDACQSGEFDHLTSPSSSIIIGKPIQTGTGAFELRHPLPSLHG